ncbi:hypothetical protein [Luteimicrobium subarcticum]|uniref:Lipoprotein n=1 Tax=Luteimicrobium subarcticum TaxID=620910 RepID=A0A2M8WJQ6_9MICO|nr:hypothetical protein [Luteimicrobium subarcticum]PJI91126.1 hypothetical protein CLV34_2393 [Luteimicrobium subarcticum]
MSAARPAGMRVAGTGLVVAIAVALAGCTGSGPNGGGAGGGGATTSAPAASARPVTSDEADRLAVARFDVWDQQWTDVDLRVPVQGDVLHLTGRADMRDHEAFAHVTSREGDALLQWTLTGKAVVPATGDSLLPTPAPTSGWQAAAMVADDPLDAALVLTLNLASDRPENPVLLQQNGARWVGTGTVDGTEVDLFTAPAGGAATDGPTGGTADARDNPLVRYAVDAKGYLRQVTADTGASEPLVVTLTPSDDSTPIDLVPALKN